MSKSRRRKAIFLQDLLSPPGMGTERPYQVVCCREDDEVQSGYGAEEGE